MQVTKNEVKVVTITYTFELSEEEFILLFEGIGVTSITSLIDAGMNKKQAEALYSLYESLSSANDDY